MTVTPQMEEFARLLSDLIAGRRFTPSEEVAFEGGPSSREFAVPVTNVARRGIGTNPRRTKLTVQNLSASDIEIGADSVSFGQGFRIPASSTYFDDVNVFKGELWLVANVAGPLDVRIREES